MLIHLMIYMIQIAALTRIAALEGPKQAHDDCLMQVPIIDSYQRHTESCRCDLPVMTGAMYRFMYRNFEDELPD